MRKFCKSCGHHWFWRLSDGRSKCRRCGLRQSFRSVWQSCRLSEASKCKLLECFVFGVPAYRLRFRGPASTEATERFFLLNAKPSRFWKAARNRWTAPSSAMNRALAGIARANAAGVLRVRRWCLVFSSAMAWCAYSLLTTARKRRCCR